MNRWFPEIIQSGSEQDRGTMYESLLDLFTLFSFALIIAAFIYATQQTSQGTDAINVEAYIADRASGTPASLPEDLLLVVVYRDQGLDEVMIIEGAGQPSIHVIGAESIKSILDGMLPVFQRANEINIVMHKGDEAANPSVFVSIQRWLSENKLNTFKVYFTGSHGE